MERKIDQIKKLRPHYARLSDDQIAELWRESYYPDRPLEEVAQALGVQMSAPAEQGSRSVGRVAGDLGLGLTSGAISGVKMISDVFGADNAVSEGLGEANQYVQQFLSAQAKADQQEQARILQEAEGKGVLEQVKAGVKAFATAPAQTVAQGLGSAAPTLAAAFIPGVGPMAAAARVGAGVTLGTAQGVGAAKGAIYEEVKRKALERGDDELAAESLAAAAQAYDGPNAAQIALSGGLGALAAVTGAEGAVRALRGGATATQATRSLAARVGLGAVTEAIPETAQGGQEKFATNTALNNAGFDQVDPWSGVAANATLEGLAAAPIGGAFAVPTPRLPDAGPYSRGVNAGLDAEEKQAAEALAKQGLAPIGITEGQYNQGMDAIMAQGEADAKALKLAGMRDNSPGVVPGRQSAAAAQGLGEAMPEVGQVGEVDALADRIMVTRESLADEQTRELIREKLGDQALREALYYVQQADVAQDIPDITRDRMLGVAEEIVSRARLTPIPDAPALGTDVGPAPEALGAPAGVPQIGLDTTPTGAFRADEQGNVFPETEADRINTRQATQARQASAGDERQGRRASAVFADEAPRQPSAPKAIGYDTAPTGRMIAGETGVMVETQAERIKREQARKVQPGDKLNPSGNPFKNIAAARTEQRRSGGAVVEVDGGWVVRPQAEDTNGRTGGTPRVPEQSGAGGAPDAIGSVGSDGRGVADWGNAVADRGSDGAGVPGDARGGQRAVPDRATGRERSDALTEVKKTPAFLKTKTVPEMTDDELRQAAEFYGPNHKRAKTIEKEMAKRAPNVPAVSEPKQSVLAAKPKTMQDMAQDLAQAIKQGGWDAYTALRSKLATDANLNVRQTLDLNGLTRSIVGVEFFDTEYAKADPEKAGRSAHARGEAPMPPDGLSEDQKARWLAAWDEGKARKDEQEPVSNDRPGEVVGEAREVSEGKGLPAPESVDATGKNASWVIREKASGTVVMETFDRKVANAINKEKYEAVPIAEHLASLNRQQGAEDGQQVQGKAPSEEVTHQQQDEFLPEGWSKSKNGFTGRAVYRREQGVGKPFAVVTQTEGIAYEVQIRHGDKQLIASDRKGALSEVLAYAQQELKRMTDADSVTHQDPGEKPEAATEGVVSSSLKTAAKNEEKSPSEMRKWLLAEIDNELLNAPDRADFDETVKRLGEKDAISMYTGNGLLGKNSETGFITFDVPGDGRFKVRNSVRGLLEFRKNVMASPGFKDAGQKTARPAENKGALDGGTKMDAITNMIEEGDFEAARDYAEAVGISLDDVKVPKGERKPQWDQFRKDGTLPPQVDTKPPTPQQPPAQGAEEERKAKEAEAKKPKDTGWNMAGTGYGGKRYIGRNITTDDGREIVARVYESAGAYDEAEVKVDGVRKFTVRDSSNAQGKADAFIKTLLDGEKLDLKGFERIPKGNGAFDLRDGNMTVSVEPIGQGKFQASFRGAKSSPHLVGEQGAVDWASAYREESQSAEAKVEPTPFTPPEGYKPAGEKFYRGGTLVQGYAPFAPGERVTVKDSAGQSGVVESLTTPDENGVFDGALVKFDNGSSQIVKFNRLTAEVERAAADADQSDTTPEETPQITEAEARKRLFWRDLGQADNTKTLGLYFAEKEGDENGMRYGTVSKFAGSRWMVDGHDGGRFEGLQPAKKKAEDLAVERLRRDGFVLQERELVDTSKDKRIGTDINGKPVYQGSDGSLKGIPYTLDERGRVRTGVAMDDAASPASDAGQASQFAAFDAVAKEYGYTVTAEGLIGKDGKFPGPKIVLKGGRLRIEGSNGNLLASYAGQNPVSIGKFLESFWYAEKSPKKTGAVPGSGRDVFTVERLNKDTNKMESVTFERGEYVRVWISNAKDDFGEIDGISQAKRQFSVNGLWHTMGAAYKAERPAEPAKNTEPLSKTIEKVNAKSGEGLGPADAVSPLEAVKGVMRAVYDGKASVDDFRSGYARAKDAEAVKAELSKMKKDDIIRTFGIMRDGKKDELVEIAYKSLLRGFALGKDYGPNNYLMTTGGLANYERLKLAALDTLVESTTAEDLADYAKKVDEERKEYAARRASAVAAMENPQTLSDFRSLLNAKIREGKTRKEAFLSLTPEQRVKYDELEAESTREEREARKRKAKTSVRAAGQATGGEIIATKHTRDGYDLFVVQLSDRLSKEDYSTVLSSAKRLGGWYSSFRGAGAIPGFQFKTRESADAFLKLAGGDTSAAEAQAQQRRDAFEDDRSQTAVERLREMADKIDERAAEELARERKTNTARRARFAASAERAPQEEKALARTMRNIAQAIESGDAKFLDEVRTKSQVVAMVGHVRTAKDNELRSKYPTYAEQEKRRGEPPTNETADFAEFPAFTAFRSDLASLARQMLDVEGTKKLGQQLMSVADDVTDAYLAFAKEPANLYKLSTFSVRQGDEIKAAIFPSKDMAERAIKRSGLTGKAIVLAEKRGVNRIIMSPSEAISRGIWTGDADKRITLTGDAGEMLVEAIGRRGNKANGLVVPWQFQNAYDRRKALARMGIETPSEFRSALREFIRLQERATSNKVREMELSMVGRKSDGLDFFPTPAEIADQMVEAADISPDMAVLEPSAGMGHIADRIRAAGAEPDVIEISGDRRELLMEKGYNLQDVTDFMDLKPREFFTFGDVFRAPDGSEGVMQGSGGMGSNRVMLKPLNADGTIDSRRGEWYSRDELVGVRHRGVDSGYDRIIMNPPFSNRRDAEHVRHAFDLLKPGGRIVAIMGEGVFFGQDKKAQEFREWLDSVGGTSEKLPAGSFMDPSLPVNTAVSARMVVIDKPTDAPAFSRAEGFRRTASAAVSAKKAEVQGIIDRLTATWKNAPEIIVLGTFDEAPESVKALNARQVAGGASGVPEAFVSGGKAYIVADQMPNEKAVAKAVFHEVLGHRGLRGVYGAELGAILDQIRKARARDVFLMAGRYGMDTDRERDMRAAAEEVLASFAEKNPQLGFVRRAVAAIRSWLRRNVPMLSNMRMTDDEIINDFIIPARRFITEGPGGPRGGMIPAFKREKDAMSRDEIAFSRSAAAGQYTAQAREAFMDFVGNAGAQVDWLDRTFKTQYAKAQKFPAFGRVFNKLQEYIEGVSTLANQAADNAPSILPKLETWRDLAKTGLSKADAKAVAAPIFQGTLEWARKDGKLVRVDDLVAQAEGMTADQKARQLFKDGKVTEQQLKTWKASPLDIYEVAVRNRYESEYLTGGVVFTTPELKSMFGLNDAQIGQYNEFRAAINDSLDQLVAADVLRLIGNVPQGMKAMALDPQGRKGLRQAVEELLADEDPALWNKVADKFNQVDRLKERGYAPLSRFGKFWVHVVDDQGQTQYFGMAETRSEANQLARALRAEFPQGTVEQGVMSQEFHKLMSAVPIDAMELFAEAIGADESEVFQKYIQLAKNNRSTMKRLMKRKGTSGFSQDVGRVLASFVTSNARAASSALHVKDAKDMARDIAAGDVKDEAIKLIESVTEPEESGAGIRSLMFTNFIGGSIASAVVNATQPFMMTLPYLSQWGGAATAGRRMLAAMQMLSGKVAQDPDLAQALKRAEDDGIVSPQEIHHLINRAAGGVGSRFPVLQKVAFVWAAPFSLAEQFNRRISFVAAYLTAKEQGIKGPFAFAEKAVIETQGLYNSGNKPNVSRGVIGATAMTFKQYSIHYLEWLARMAKSGPDGKRAALLALALLMLAAGTDGLPFMDDLDDVLDTAGQAMGYDMNTKRSRREFIASVLGEELGEVATRGLSAAAGFPVDLSLRMGMGNLLPATDLLMKSNTDSARSLAEIAGPGGSMFIQYRDAAQMILNGDLLGGAAKALPVAGRNLVKGIEMGQEGEYRDSLGRRVMETSPLEAGMKALSFQPATVARESARMQESRQSENLAKQVENEIVDKWARAIADRDRDAEKEALKMRDEWNAKNPDMPIVVKRSQAIRKARNLKMDRRERYIKTVAPERRDSVNKEMG